ncbi:hypothetical protein TV39_07750 [Arthrobacter sp. SPG23]|nr:hypothetical protein TV39_07750 [Arthrobacter sp. SPG23]
MVREALPGASVFVAVALGDEMVSGAAFGGERVGSPVGCVEDGVDVADGATVVGSAVSVGDGGSTMAEAAGGTAIAKQSASIAAVDQIPRCFIEPHPPKL